MAKKLIVKRSKDGPVLQKAKDTLTSAGIPFRYVGTDIDGNFIFQVRDAEKAAQILCSAGIASEK